MFRGSTSCVGAGDGNRTRTTSLEGWSSAIELPPHGFILHLLHFAPCRHNMLCCTNCQFLRSWLSHTATIYLNTFCHKKQAPPFRVQSLLVHEIVQFSRMVRCAGASCKASESLYSAFSREGKGEPIACSQIAPVQAFWWLRIAFYAKVYSSSSAK